PEQRADWLSDRRSVIIGRSLANQYKWKIGDTVPNRSSFFRKANDGGDTWDIRTAGIFDASNGDVTSLFFHYDYVNEAMGENAGRDIVIWAVMKIRNPADAQKVSAEIDGLFANSPAETKTGTESAFIQGFANQMGDIATIVTAIASAVFFTMLLVTANTMAQSVRERTNEIAVLKTLGYSKQTVAGLVLGESFAITAIGGVIGLGIATAAAGFVGSVLAQFFPASG